MQGEAQRLEAADSQFKTTMVVRLHPGQSRRLSQCSLDNQVPGEHMRTNVTGDGEMESRTYMAEVQSGACDNPNTVCGLEITFETVPQSIDIKLLPGPGEENETIIKTDIREKSMSKEAVDKESGDDKTRQ